MRDMIDKWQPFVKAVIKAILIIGLGNIVHEFGHYITAKASGGEVLGFVYDPIAGTMVMTIEAPVQSSPLIMLSGGLAGAVYYALLSIADRRYLVPAALSLGYSYGDMSLNYGAMFVLGHLSNISVFIANLVGPDGKMV